MIFSKGLARFTFVCVNRVSVACQRFPVQGSDVLSVNLKCGPSNFVHTIPHGPPRCLATINSRSTDSAFPASKITISASCPSASLHCAPRPLAWRRIVRFRKSSPVDPCNYRSGSAAPFLAPKRGDFCLICADLQTRHRPNRFRSVRSMTAI